MKRCNRCGEEKSLSGFYFRKGKPANPCKVCSIKIGKKQRDRNILLYGRSDFRWGDQTNRPPARKGIGARRIRHQYMEIKTSQGWELESHIIVEEKYGRELRANEIVHHMDHNRLNNSPDNLMIITKARHTIIHMTGIKQSEESKRKRSRANKGQKRSLEIRKKMSLAQKGIPKSEETKEKIRETLSGRKLSKEHKRNVSIGLRKWWAERRVS